MPHREAHPAHRLRSEDVHDVGLVLAGVGAAGDPPPAIGVRHDASVVTGGDGIEAEGVGPPEEPVELQVAVALDAGVRGATGGVVGHIGRHDVLVEVIPEVEDVVLDAEATRNGASVVHVGHRAATGVRCPSPQLQGGAHDIVAGLHEESGGHGGVHAA